METLVFLERIVQSDLSLLYAWSKLPRIWDLMPTSRKNEVLTWENHVKWFNNRPRDRRDYLISVRECEVLKRVGSIHVTGLSNETAEIGLYIVYPDMWNKRIGQLAVERIILLTSLHNRPFLDMTLRTVEARCKKLLAVVHPNNKASIAMFTKCGFKYVGEGRNGQGNYEYTIS